MRALMPWRARGRNGKCGGVLFSRRGYARYKRREPNTAQENLSTDVSPILMHAKDRFKAFQLAQLPFFNAIVALTAR